VQQLIRLKHIKIVTARLADGSTKVFRYHRRTGEKIEGEPGTPEFLRSYSEQVWDPEIFALTHSLA
jgi:hypothetical protein